MRKQKQNPKKEESKEQYNWNSMTEIEMQKKSWASHKAVATKYWTEAESLILPTRSVSVEDDLIRLDQLHKNLAGKQNFLSDLNSKI